RTVLMNPDKQVLEKEDLKLLELDDDDFIREEGQLFKGKIFSLPHLEAKAIREALAITQGNIQQASDQLEISRVTFYRKMKEYGIKKEISIPTS
ncbi:MAG: DUF1492 domain-containing protein, partial [Proteobacteria bacterium]|nr:DUF1492 domain-containing protein [Pseudomonadota bacterium]